MAFDLPDCSAITQLCTTCLFDASYTTIDPPFTVNYTATSTPTVTADVTTFANGSITTNIVEATQVIESSARPAFETWESDNLTFTYGSTYLSYTAFIYATPPPPVSLADNTLACYSGNPADDTTLSQLSLPSSTAAGSLIVTLTEDQPLPSQSVPAEIMAYLDSLPTVSEQLNGNPLSICSATTPPTPSCTSRIPSNCPAPTVTTVVTSIADGLPETVIRNGTLAQRDVAEQTALDRRQDVYYTTTSALPTFNYNGTLNTTTTTFPPGCPQTATITEIISQPAFPSSPQSSSVQATTKETRNAINVGPATTLIRSFTSLSVDPAPSRDPAVVPAPNDSPENEPQPAPQPPPSPADDPSSEAQPASKPDGNPSPAAQPASGPGDDPNPAGQPATSPNDDSSPAIQPAPGSNNEPNPVAEPASSPNNDSPLAAQPASGSNDGASPQAQPASNPDNDANPAGQAALNSAGERIQGDQSAPSLNNGPSPPSDDQPPLPAPKENEAPNGEPEVAIYTAVLPKVTSYTTIVMPGDQASDGSESANNDSDSPQGGAYTRTIPLTNGIVTLTITEPINPGQPTSAAGSTNADGEPAMVVRTTVVPDGGTGSVTLSITYGAVDGATSTANVGDYINGGLGATGTGTQTASGSTSSYSGMANRLGAADVRGLLGVGVGALMGL